MFGPREESVELDWDSWLSGGETGHEQQPQDGPIIRWMLAQSGLTEDSPKLSGSRFTSAHTARRKEKFVTSLQHQSWQRALNKGDFCRDPSRIEKASVRSGLIGTKSMMSDPWAFANRRVFNAAYFRTCSISK
jgi:hypothetical protein